MSMFAAELLCLLAIILAGIAASVIGSLMIEHNERKAFKRKCEGLVKPAEQPRDPENERADT